MRLLLDKGADVNAESGPALRAASEKGPIVIMRLLLRNKAHVKVVLPPGFLLTNTAHASLVSQHDAKSLQEVSVDDHEAVIQLLLKTKLSA